MPPKILELFIHFTKEELEILMSEYEDEMAIKFAVSRLLNKEIANHCEKITMTDKWLFRNSVIEIDESEEVL